MEVSQAAIIPQVQLQVLIASEEMADDSACNSLQHVYSVVFGHSLTFRGH